MLPCPSWCVFPSGHLFEAEEVAGFQYRYHVAAETVIDIGYRQARYPQHPVNVAIDITAREVANSGGHVVGVDFPRLGLAVDLEMVDITTDEARIIAAALFEAADKLDSLNSEVPLEG